MSNHSPTDNKKYSRRRRLDPYQYMCLMNSFYESNYPDRVTKSLLSLKTQLPLSFVTTWFQNRRANLRRKHNKDVEDGCTYWNDSQNSFILENLNGSVSYNRMDLISMMNRSYRRFKIKDCTDEIIEMYRKKDDQ